MRRITTLTAENIGLSTLNGVVFHCATEQPQGIVTRAVLMYRPRATATGTPYVHAYLNDVGSGFDPSTDPNMDTNIVGGQQWATSNGAVATLAAYPQNQAFYIFGGGYQAVGDFFAPWLSILVVAPAVGYADFVLYGYGT